MMDKQQKTIKMLFDKVAYLSNQLEITNNKITNQSKGLISNKKLLDQMGICAKTAYNWRCDGMESTVINGRVYYSQSDIDNYLQKFKK